MKENSTKGYLLHAEPWFDWMTGIFNRDLDWEGQHYYDFWTKAGLPIPMMTIITSGEPYPTIRDLVMVLLGFPNVFALKHWVLEILLLCPSTWFDWRCWSSWWSSRRRWRGSCSGWSGLDRLVRWFILLLRNIPRIWQFRLSPVWSRKIDN